MGGKKTRKDGEITEIWDIMNNRYPIYNGNRLATRKLAFELLDRNNVSRKDVSSTGLLLENKFLETEPGVALLLHLTGFIYEVIIHETRYYDTYILTMFYKHT